MKEELVVFGNLSLPIHLFQEGHRVNRSRSPTINFTSRRTTAYIGYIAWFQDSERRLACKAETKLEEAMAEVVHLSTSIKEARHSKHESTSDGPSTKNIYIGMVARGSLELEALFGYIA